MLAGGIELQLFDAFRQRPIKAEDLIAFAQHLSDMDMGFAL